jgi:hypothetical protein
LHCNQIVCRMAACMHTFVTSRICKLQALASSTSAVQQHAGVAGHSNSMQPRDC